MSRNANRQREPLATGTGDAINLYLTALQEFYLPSKGNTRVVVRPNHRVIVTTPLPVLTKERMRLFDQMSEVGTRLLLETDQYIILSGR